MPCCGRKTNPNLAQQAMSVAGAAGRAVLAWVSGQAVYSEAELVQARLKTCAKCGYLTNLKPKGPTCSMCKCPLTRDGSLPGKAQLRTESCPIGKWDSLSPKPE